MKKMSAALVYLSLFNGIAHAQKEKFRDYEVQAVNIQMSQVEMMGMKTLRAVKNSTVTAFDEPTFIRLNNVEFKNGIITVKILSRLLPNAPDMARGFIGITFHLNDSNTKYESIYLRPVNSRVDDQVRRNHSIQYYAYPDYKFDRLRKESPEKYESFSDMEMNKWITMRIEVKDAQAKLFIDNNQQPSLIVNDLKLGANVIGSVALWVDIGTEGFFTDLKISKK